MSKNLPESSPCSETLWEARFKDDGPIKLAQKSQGSLALVLCHGYGWLLTASVTSEPQESQVDRFRKPVVRL